MPDERPCLLCGNSVDGEREFHEMCWPAAKHHMDVVVLMARRKYGEGFALNVLDSQDGMAIFPVIGAIVGGPTKEIVEEEDPEPSHDETFIKAPCICEKDIDGRCPGCIGIISDYLKGVLKIQRDSVERLSKIPTIKDVCEACSTDYLDFSLARTVREILAPMVRDHPEFRDSIRGLAKAMRGQFDTRGVRSWPLFEKAMKELGLE